MSVGAIGSTAPDPGFFSYPSVPAAPSTAAPAASSTPTSASAPASSSTSAKPSATSTISSYRSEYDTLLQQDASELLQVSLATPAAAQSNVADVLAQAAALQDQQLAAQRQAQSTATVPTIATPDIPTLASLQQQSDTDAGTDLTNGTLGASIDNFA